MKNCMHGYSSSNYKKLSLIHISAIVVPQRITNRRPLVEVVMRGVSYLRESSFVFKSGMHHIVSLTITKNPEQVKIEISGEIDNWEKMCIRDRCGYSAGCTGSACRASAK